MSHAILLKSADSQRY